MTDKIEIVFDQEKVDVIEAILDPIEYRFTPIDYPLACIMLMDWKSH